MLSKREFFGKHFYAFLQQTHDEAAYFLKNCGKPLDEIDRWFINEAKFTIQYTRRLLK